MKELKVYRLCCADCKKELGTVAYFAERGDVFLDKRMQAQICTMCAQVREEKRQLEVIRLLRESIEENG